MNMDFSRDALSFTHMERGLGGYCLRAVLASCLALTVVTGPTLGWAGDKGKQNAQHHHLINHQRLQELKQRIADLRQQMKQYQQTSGGTSNDTVEALQSKVASLESSITALISSDNTLLTSLQAAQAQITSLQARIAMLESRPAGGGGGVPDLEKYVEINPNDINGVKGPHLIFKGVNVHVRSGSGSTVDSTGLGNLIVGYNESLQNGTGLNRTGSHNLVGGQMNAFSSSGGLVFGSKNSVFGRFSAILGGENNSLSGMYSTVYGAQFGSSVTSYDFLPAFPVVGN